MAQWVLQFLLLLLTQSETSLTRMLFIHSQCEPGSQTQQNSSALSSRDKRLRMDECELQNQSLKVLPSIHFFSKRFWGREGVSTRTLHRAAQVMLEEIQVQRREQNACSGPCPTEPVFHLSSDPVQNLSAQAGQAAPEFSFWKKKTFSWEICHLNSLRLLLHLAALSRAVPTRLTINTGRSGGAALPQETELGGFMPPLNKLKL